MSHLYKMVKNTNEKMTGSYNKWYARPVYNGTVDLDWIAERIQRNSTAKKSDAKAVLTEMVEVITDALQNSQRVKIDGFGTFKIGISTRGVEKIGDFSMSEHLKGARVMFQPETKVDGSTRKHVKAMLAGLSFKNTADLANGDEITAKAEAQEETPTEP